MQSFRPCCAHSLGAESLKFSRPSDRCSETSVTFNKACHQAALYRGLNSFLYYSPDFCNGIMHSRLYLTTP